MPRGRKRKHVPFVPPRWIHNTSSEDEVEQEDPFPGDGKFLRNENPDRIFSNE